MFLPAALGAGLTPAMGPSWPCDSPRGLAGPSGFFPGGWKLFLNEHREFLGPSPPSLTPLVPSDCSGLWHKSPLLLSWGMKLHRKEGCGQKAGMKAEGKGGAGGAGSTVGIGRTACGQRMTHGDHD